MGIKAWYAWGIAMFFALWQNAYFGRHSFPQSDAELMADGMALLLVAIAVLVWAVEGRK